MSLPIGHSPPAGCRKFGKLTFYFAITIGTVKRNFSVVKFRKAPIIFRLRVRFPCPRVARFPGWRLLMLFELTVLWPRFALRWFSGGRSDTFLPRIFPVADLRVAERAAPGEVRP